MRKTKRIERTQSDLSMEAHGNGGPPERPTVIISDSSGNGITAGKEYPVVAHQAWVYIVRNDNGHERVFSMYSTTHAHAKHYDPLNPPMARVFEEVEED